MEPLQLEAMSLEDLRRLAGACGIRAPESLDRDALIAALRDLGLPVGPSGGHPTSLPARPWEYDSEAMARMYMQQGLAERAIEILRELVGRRPGDATLVALLAEAERAAEEQARRRLERPRPRVEAPYPDEPFGMLDLEEPPETYGVDEVEVLFQNPFWVFVYWEVTQSGMDGARAQLGDEGRDARLVLRMFSTGPGSAQLTRDVPLDAWHGRRYLPSPRPDARLRVAVGLVARSGLFAPLAHSSVVKVPPAEPAPYDPSAVDWLEVRPEQTRGVEREPVEIVRHVPPEEAPGGSVPLAVHGGRPIPEGERLGAQSSPSASDLPGAPTSPWRRPPSGSSS